MLATQGIKHSSLKGYLSALRYLQLQGIGTDPKVGDMALLQQTIKGIKRVQSHQNLQPRVRLPITTEVLRAMQRSWNRDPYDYRNVMLWAASAVCFFGFFRSGEITVPSASNFDASCHLTLNDLSVDDPRNPKAICINLKQSKTDPFRRGIQVFIGATNDRLCPVAALMAYLTMRDKSTSTPLFKFQNNEPLSRDRFVMEVRKALREAGIDQSKYAGHSFRIGAATEAAARGLEDSLIKALGRWESAAYQVYVKLPRQSLISITPQLSKQISN